MNRKACSRRAAIFRRPACWRRTGAASSPGIRRANRCCGGHRIRAKCCCPRNSNVRVALRKRCEIAASKSTFDRDFSAVVRACAARRENSTGTWITPEMHAAYCELHAQGSRAQRGGAAGRRAGRRPLRGAHGQRVLRRIHVQSRARRIESSACPAVRNAESVAGLTLIDCQLPTPHLRTLGSKPVSRREFSALVAGRGCRPGRTLVFRILKIARL